MKIVAISDTHMWGMPLVDLPEGDVLVHAGDATYRGTLAEFNQFKNELVKHLKDNRYKKGYKHIVFVPGNHDWGFEKQELLFRELFSEYSNVHILINEDVVIDGVKFWGSPVCPPFGRWAFYQSEKRREDLWSYISEDTDVLITHGPPKGILDEVSSCWDLREVEHAGCDPLFKRVTALKPKIHIFGHVHEGYGSIKIGKTQFINASIMDERYQSNNEPIVIEV